VTCQRLECRPRSRGTHPFLIVVAQMFSCLYLSSFFVRSQTDGIFVGTAFLNCNRDLAITISAATIYHEIAQEIADYFMLTRFCNIPPWYALGLNFINGLSVLFGAIIIVGIEDMADVAIGSILAVSSGVYFYISVAECFPLKKKVHKLISMTIRRSRCSNGSARVAAVRVDVGERCVWIPR